MQRIFSLFLVLSVFLCISPAKAAPADDAAQAAQEWLALVDADDTAQSWEKASAMFRQSISQEKWQNACGQARGPLGPVESRRVASAVEATNLPGAPKGNYVLVQFTTRFANKKEAVETVTLQKESDGIWRVAGYFIG